MILWKYSLSSLLIGSNRLLMRDDTEGASYSKDRNVLKIGSFSGVNITILYKSTLDWLAQFSSFMTMGMIQVYSQSHPDILCLCPGSTMARLHHCKGMSSEHGNPVASNVWPM